MGTIPYSDVGAKFHRRLNPLFFLLWINENQLFTLTIKI